MTKDDGKDYYSAQEMIDRLKECRDRSVFPTDYFQSLIQSLEHYTHVDQYAPLTIDRAVLRANDHFAFNGTSYEKAQHLNQQRGLDLYVSVLKLSTGNWCEKKLYRSKKGLYFRHTRYPPMYLHEMTQTVTHIPYQVHPMKKEETTK